MNDAALEATASISACEELLSEERLFDLLGNERRRSCLHCLVVVDTTVTVQDLAGQVATRVSDEGTSPEDIRNSVYISLCQNHLPKLDDAGVVDYDPAEKTVGPGPAFPVVERYLQTDATGNAGQEMTRYYLLASVLTVFVLGIVTYVVPAALTYGMPALIAVHALAAVASGRQLRRPS